MERPRLKDVAARADVSPSAVSKVLNDQPIRIGDDKRGRILRAAAELGYRPNLIARGLQSRGTQTIGVALPGISSHFYPEMVAAIEATLAPHGFHAILCNTRDDPDEERVQIETLISRLVDGVIVAPAPGARNRDLYRRLERSATPVAFMDRYVPSERVSFVVTDNAGGAQLAVDYLADEGARRVYYIGEEPRNPALDDRLRGARETAAERGLTLDGNEVALCPPDDRDALRRETARLLPSLDKGDAIFLESCRLALGVLDALAEAGMTVPADVRVVGFDEPELRAATRRDFAALASLREPVPYVRQPVDEIGRRVAEHLLDRITGRTATALRLQLPAELVLP